MGTNPEQLGNIADERSAREAFLKEPDDSCERAFEAALRSCLSAADQERLRGVDRFARQLPYSHPGQSAKVYYAHPQRVATMYLTVAPDADGIGAGIALVHNVLEVTDTTVDTIRASCGPEIARALEVLTVDRTRQSDPQYRSAYYGVLRGEPRRTGAVKVLDKLDNLFLLSRNPDDAVRSRYLREIEDEVVPLAERALPAVVEYLKELVAYNRATGYSPPAP